MKIELENAVVYQGSNLDVLPNLPDNSVDSIVTDPPYELGFMGKSWDNSGIAYSVELWTECMRVLKPGGHLLAFGGSRTWHRLAVAIEDAGFEMRDSIAWLYGSGFPKSMNVSKAIEGLLTTGSSQKNNFHQLTGEKDTNARIGMWDSAEEQGFRKKNPEQLGAFDLEATTPEAKQWQGWGTALKPAFEPVVVARKPLEEKTVAANVLKYGTGGLNIDSSRIGTEGATTRSNQADYPKNPDGTEDRSGSWARTGHGIEAINAGRWPANIILDPYTAELLDEQSGERKGMATQRNSAGTKVYGGNALTESKTEFPEIREGYNDTGGASRFFYVAKASKKDRNEGCELLPDHEWRNDGAAIPNRAERPFLPSKNHHPTVKPTTLMEYLIKLVTPPNGTVLDPFTGSGSTGKAALLSGFKFIGIELTEEYLPIIEGRLKWASEQASKKEEEKNEVLF